MSKIAGIKAVYDSQVFLSEIVSELKNSRFCIELYSRRYAVFQANIIEYTAAAIRRTGLAGMSAVQEHPMVSIE